ncbi:GyrI-like domain-containing protein [Microlunatus ginsengisoli]|uniref:GyrI-like domain-containing protein n=1 Tax=Microlunatus ginsengisoli TaxID=363863 RepID=UPI0031CFAB16
MTARYQVALEAHPRQRTLVVPATTTWAAYPSLWPVLLDEVWSLLRAAGIDRGCPNVMLYRGDRPRVEVGVLHDGELEPAGRVVVSSLPAGTVATTTHHGSYAGLADAHRAVVDWCREQGIALSDIRWELYGPHAAEPALVWTRVCWLVAEDTGGSAGS